MHLSFFALKQYSKALASRLHNCTFINAFSFSKEEIVFSFLTPSNKEVFLSVNIVNKSCYFQWLENYNRPKRNFLYQFQECDGGIVNDVVQVNFDRSFYIHLKTNFKILFKLHGGFSNIIVLNAEDEVENIFRKELTNDYEIQLQNLAKSYEISQLYNETTQNEAGLKKILPLIDILSLEFLTKSGFYQMDSIHRRMFFSSYFTEANRPFFLILNSSNSRLQLFPETKALEYKDPIEAYTKLARLVLPSFQSENAKRDIELQINTRITKVERQIFSNKKQFDNASNFQEYENIGHIIMANMHNIPPKITNISLFDFYKNNTVEIRLDKLLNAQENAEKYYRKSKALKQEVQTLIQKSNELNDQKLKLEKQKDLLTGLFDTKTLKTFASEHGYLKINEEEVVFPFRKMLVDDYEIWIGKNAANNDLLTFGYANKNDIWMHAKDVSGSHLIIRNQSGKIISKPTLEKAAALAAYFSKSKNQTLAVVQYTIRKFVVKAKGRNPGAVHLLSEQTLMVKPFCN